MLTMQFYTNPNTNESHIQYNTREYLILCNEYQRRTLEWLINSKGWYRAALGFIKKHNIPQIPFNKKG